MARRSVQGFTLIELMVVATIIGVSVIAFAPAFVLSMAERRAAGALSEVARIGRKARADTIGTQRPHLVWMQVGAGPEESSIVQLIRGNAGLCDIQPWLTLSQTCALTPRESSDPVCLANLDLNDRRWFRHPLQIRLRTVQPGRESGPDLVAAIRGSEAVNYAICYEPSGITRWAMPNALTNPVTTFVERNEGVALGGAFVFAAGVYDRDEGAVKGMPRVLAYVLGTTPRRVR